MIAIDTIRLTLTRMDAMLTAACPACLQLFGGKASGTGPRVGSSAQRGVSQPRSKQHRPQQQRRHREIAKTGMPFTGGA